MKRLAKIQFVACLAALAVFSVLLCSACDSSEERDANEIIHEITSQYSTYGDRSDKTLEGLLKELDKKDQVAGDKWRSIISLWKQSNNDLKLNYDVLPDGLPKTDEFCMVALGYQLNSDGTMKDELVGRLNVVKASAEKYPNALIVCTGGHTAYENREVSEAGRMAEWLIENGIAEQRIIVEDNSLTTAQNAAFSLELLTLRYPQVTKLAIISSDYHIATGNLLFGAQSTLLADKAGNEKYEVVSNAAYNAPTGALSTSFQAGALNELPDDRETARKIYNHEYVAHEVPSIDD